MTDREARGMRFAIRFTRRRLQSFGAAVAQLGRKDSLPSGPLCLCQVVVGSRLNARLREFLRVVVLGHNYGLSSE